MKENNDNNVIDIMFEKYLIKYINLHFREYHNSYIYGEEFIYDILKKTMKSRIPEKKRFILSIKWFMKYFNIKEFIEKIKGEN